MDAAIFRPSPVQAKQGTVTSFQRVIKAIPSRFPRNSK